MLYLASQVPLVQVPTNPPSQAGCTNTTTTAGTVTAIGSGAFPNEIALKLNQFMSNVAAGYAYGGGFGVMAGLTGSTTSGSLALPIAAGWGNIAGTVEFSGGTITVPDSTSLGFIWLLQNGTLDYTLTTTPPTTNCIYICNFTTVSGSITVVDYSGVVYCTGGGLFRTTNDRSGPTDTPPTGILYHTQTKSGLYHYNGAGAYNRLTSTTNGVVQVQLSLTSTLQLIPQDSACQLLISCPSGNEQIWLPNPSSLPNGWNITLLFIGSANEALIYDYTGVTHLATLTTTNVSLSISTYMNSSGNVVFPGGTWTPGPFPTPSASSSPA